MAFKRIGSPVKIVDKDLRYDQEKETPIICPKCKATLGYQNKGLVRSGSAIMIGTKTIQCTNCKGD